MGVQEVRQAPAGDYIVIRETASDTESSWRELPDDVYRVDIFVEDAPLLVRFRLRGKGAPHQIRLPVDFFYSIDCQPEAYTVQNATAGQNSTYQLVAWVR